LDAQVSRESRRRRATFIRRIVMDKPVVGFAVGAAIIAAVALGLFELITPYQSGVIQAQEKKAEDKKPGEIGLGFTCRTRKTGSQSGWPLETTEMVRESPQYGCRVDYYYQDKLTSSLYRNYADGTIVTLFPARKVYTRRTVAKGPPPAGGLADPRPRSKKALAGEHKKLGRRTIDGVEAEGIEVPEISGTIARGTMSGGVGMGMSGGGGSNAPSGTAGNIKLDVITSGVVAASQFWSSVETGLPILVEESAAIDKDGYRMKWITDQFHWNVRFDPNEFKARIPADYQLVDEQQLRQRGFGGRGSKSGSAGAPAPGQRTRR
jgi:hypothetical protein